MILLRATFIVSGLYISIIGVGTTFTVNDAVKLSAVAVTVVSVSCTNPVTISFSIEISEPSKLYVRAFTSSPITISE